MTGEQLKALTLEQMFSSIRGAAFMPYVCCGDPSEDFTVKFIHTLVQNGADAIELGIPFSDPIADGPTIQAASNRALQNGATPLKAIDLMKRLRTEGITVPIIPMTYYNILYAQGTELFLKLLKDAGATGVIIPDVPLEESKELLAAAKNAGVHQISFITPTSSQERVKEITKTATGFLYVVAVLGTTGVRETVQTQTLDIIKMAKNESNIPLAVGFGISKPEHALAYVKAGVKGIIVGSPFVNIYSKHINANGFDDEKALEEIAEFTRVMKNSCKG